MALIGLPRLLHDIIARLVQRQPDMELVRGGSPAVLGATGPHVAIVAMGKDQLPMWLPHIAVLGVTERGNRTVVCRLRPQSAELGELSPDELLAAARQLAGEVNTIVLPN